ncbi:MAG: cryptochrome/photolyase family protein [Candidatus Puniceispirillaceae bacterium]
MSPSIAIMWFRADLRLSDNPALCAACEDGQLLPIYILEDDDAEVDKMGAASRLWLHHSLSKLNEGLAGKLQLFAGSADAILQQLTDRYDITAIHWNRAYEPWRINRDKQIKTALQDKGIKAQSHKANLLWEPWEVTKNDGTPYRVFTPFYRRGCLGTTPPRRPLSQPDNLTFASGVNEAVTLDSLELRPRHHWQNDVVSGWQVGETGAMARLSDFLDNGIAHYSEGRNLPDKPFVSRLSPHLHFGEISANQCWHQALDRFGMDHKGCDVFLSELGWREFSASLLFYNHDLKTTPLNGKFAHFPWRESDDDLAAWQAGMTGYPIVDAGMRELYQTGYMHNRVRMIVGSFLVKNLRLHWQHGEAWFWDCLFDADHASNSASWQWIAGCGADAAPYFRVFNPITQAEKFDQEAHYIKKFVPELKDLPAKYCAAPFTAPPEILRAANITLGVDYPLPVVDAKQSRLDALAAFATLKEIS